VREGDRVTCIHNDYTVEPDGLMNGEQGVVRAVEGDALRLLLDDGREVRTRGVQNKSVALAFAATVHRAQGSEYPVVLLVYHRSHAPLLDQRVLYTGVTRAKQRVILCADPEALRVSAATGAALERCSGLAARIRRRQRARSAE
jgi:exodeoxyribonuclease V alpha subunit